MATNFQIVEQKKCISIIFEYYKQALGGTFTNPSTLSIKLFLAEAKIHFYDQ